MISVNELYLGVLLALSSVIVAGVITVFVWHKQVRLVKALVFILFSGFVAMGRPYGQEAQVFLHFIYYGAAYFGGLPALLLSALGGQSVAYYFGNAVVGMPRSVIIAGIWGLMAHKGKMSQRWQEQLISLWPAALFLAVPGYLPGEALLSATGMTITVLFCGYIVRRGYSYMAMPTFLRAAGSVMFIDNHGAITYTSPFLAQRSALAACLSQELLVARARGLGQSELGEAEISCVVAGERQTYLLTVSPLTLPMAESGWVALFRDVTAIKSAQNQLQQFFDLSAHGFAALGSSGEILWVNHAVAHMLLASPRELVGKNFLDFIAAEDVAAMTNVWKLLREGKFAPRYGKVRIITTSQREVWISWSGVYSPTEKAVHVVVRSIHQHVVRQGRLLEQIRRHSKQAKLLDLVQEAIMVYDLSLGIISANEAANGLYSTDFSTCSGVCVDDLLMTRYPQPLEDIKKELQARGQWTGVISRTSQTGKPLIILARWTLSQSEVGDTPKIIEICSDYRTALQDARRRRLLAAIVDSTDDGVISLAEDGEVLTWNNGAARIFGYTASEVLGRRVQELCLPESLPAVEAALLAALSGQTTEGCRDFLPHKAGKTVYTSAVFSPLGGPEKALRTASLLVSDVTAQRLLEKEKLRIDRVSVSGQIAAGLGHELRNSLTTVRGFLQLFRSYKDFSGVSSQLDIVQADLMSAYKIVASFLALAGFRDVERMPAQINDIIAQAVPLLAAEGLKDSHYIRVELGAVESLLLCRTCIFQLITNLARNGLQAMVDGGTLTIATEQTETEVLLLIKDEGTGIDPSINDKIWTPFFTSRPGLVGLGLAVCESIAVLHHATIGYLSTSSGTVFTVAFPRELKEGGDA